MLFNSIQFALFFVVVMAVFYLMPPRLRVWWVLLSSLFFYCFKSVEEPLNEQSNYLFIAIIISWSAGVLMDVIPSKGKLKALRVFFLVAGLAVDFGMLFWFKYTEFFMELLHAPGAGSFNLLMPLGISFFIFTSTGYLFDVYRGKVHAEKNPLYYALFTCFFPCIMSGPIERADHLIPQLRNLHKVKVLDADRMSNGIILIVWGLFAKMVIADRIAMIVDNVYGSYYLYGSVELIFASVCYSIQIYCDFMSYSTIAMGCAKLMGIDVYDNFNAPYLSLSVKEFWRRWHISLSSWLKDYVYIPLGGSRCSKIRKYLNVIITFLVSGLWHGAGLNFILWGGIHGALQVADDITLPARNKLNSLTHAKTDSFGHRFFKGLITFALIDLAWVYFRVTDFKVANEIIVRMFTKPDLWVLFNDGIYNLGLDRKEFNVLFIALIILVVMDLARKKKDKSIGDIMISQPWYFRWTVIIVLLFAILTFGIYGPAFDAANFIYLQF